MRFGDYELATHLCYLPPIVREQSITLSKRPPAVGRSAQELRSTVAPHYDAPIRLAFSRGLLAIGTYRR